MDTILIVGVFVSVIVFFFQLLHRTVRWILPKRAGKSRRSKKSGRAAKPRGALRNPPKAKVAVTATGKGKTKGTSGWCRVVDGDTIVINGLSIRLAGIDAPEMDHPYGKSAKRCLANLTDGHTIRAQFHGEQSYAREVATCYLPDGRDLSAEMVKAGFAIDWPKFSGGKYSHLEVPNARKRMWRADARQKGRWPPQANS